MPQLIKKSEIEKYMSPIGDTLVLLGLSGTFLGIAIQKFLNVLTICWCL